MTDNKTTWAKALLTPQTFMYLFGAMVAVVVFWTKTETSWEKQKALEERVTRQYETMNKTLERIIVLEKAQEFQKGYDQAKKDFSPKN